MNWKSPEPKWCPCCKTNKPRNSGFQKDTSQWDLTSKICAECLSTGRNNHGRSWRPEGQRYPGKSTDQVNYKKIRTKTIKKEKE